MGSNVKIHFFRTWSCCISNKRESRMQQHGRKYFGHEPPPTPSNPWGQKVKIKFFTEYYHIKLNRFSNSETCQQIFCLHTFSLPNSTLGVGLKVKIQLIENMVMLHMKLNRIAKAATCKYFVRRSPLATPLTLWSKVNLFRTWSCCISN